MDRLLPGQKLDKGQSIQSSNGLYTLILQQDGNLVIYSQGKAIWASNTAGRAVSQAIMQTDGNFVIYGYPNAVWATGTNGWNNAYIVMQDDGNLVVYGFKAAWASGTNRVTYRSF
ncbi:lectin [Paenibacillus odorifer]|uniref:Lectin n=1 Tax=Paenibacillus odorifer TaxID=189426 RepID=A0AAD0KNV2_9BACL|nr:lectin [Paenibacillus odorifer]AWV35185.1 lectin [Paenibacillus odorifer]